MHRDLESGTAKRRVDPPMAQVVGRARMTGRRMAVLATGALTASQAIGATGAGAAHAAVDPGACTSLTGTAQSVCQNTASMVNQGVSNSTSSNPLNALTDPLGSVADACANAAVWIINHLSSAVATTTTVDFTNAGFLKQYAVVFAAATILTLLLWLLAVVKRAVHGESIGTAVGQAAGLLWVAVIASAFTPIVLYGMVKLTDAVSDAIASGTNQGTNTFLAGFANALKPNGGANSLGGGPVMLIFLSLLSMVAASLLWIELLVRAAMLYVGAALAAAVYAGLVDRALWIHVRRWAGMMVAIDLAKPVIVIVLGLATAVSAGTPHTALSAVLSGLAILFLSIFASTVLYRFVPHFGDDMLALRQGRMAANIGKGAAGVLDTPAARMRQGIAAHGARAPQGGEQPAIGSSSVTPSTAVAMGAGIVAHGARSAASRLSQARHLSPARPQPPPASGGYPRDLDSGDDR